MTDAPKTPDHSIPIIGVPLKTDGTLYNDRVARVHGPMKRDGMCFKNQHGMVFYSHGNYTTYETHDLDLISEHIPPAKVVRFSGQYYDQSIGPYYDTLESARLLTANVTCIIELHEVARHPVAPDKGDM